MRVKVEDRGSERLMEGNEVIKLESQSGAVLGAVNPPGPLTSDVYLCLGYVIGGRASEEG